MNSEYPYYSDWFDKNRQLRGRSVGYYASPGEVKNKYFVYLGVN
jgi:hypothetical protein